MHFSGVARGAPPRPQQPTQTGYWELMAGSRRRCIYPGSLVEGLPKKASLIDEERQNVVKALLLVSASVSTMSGSLGNVDCLYFIGTLLDLTCLPSWVMVS